MVTPAVDVNSGTTAPCQMKRWDQFNNGSSGTVLTTNSAFVQSWEFKKRPASGNSPVRTDGSRAPRAWDHRWGGFQRPVRTAANMQIYSNRRYMREFVSSPLIGFASLSQYLNACNASWVASSGVFDYTAEASARTAYRLALIGGRVEWGVTLGEMRETVRGITTYCEDTLRLIEYLAKKTRQAKRTVVETILGIPPRSRRTPPWYKGKDRLIIDHWLAYQFAAKPLLNDIQSSGEELSRLLFEEEKPLRFKLKRGGSNVERYEVVQPSYPFSHGFTGIQIFERESQCHISCVHDIVKGTTRKMEQLGLSNPISIGWELTPLSWGVDYVTNVGDWLSSLAPIQGSSFVEGSLTRVMRVRSEGPAFNVRPAETASPRPEYAYGNLAGIGVNLQAGRMQRVVLTQNPQPALGPIWRNRLGLTRMANVLAVMSKLLAR